MIGLRRSFFATSSNPLLRDLYLLGKKYDGYFNDDLNFFTINGPIATAQTYNISGFTNSADNYSWLFKGYFIPTTTETYTFYTNSDDASYLWIGVDASGDSTTSNALVNNGSTHPLQERSGSVALQANTLYPIKIAFGESVGDDTLTVSFSTPTINKTTNGFNFYRGGQYAWNNWSENVTPTPTPTPTPPPPTPTPPPVNTFSLGFANISQESCTALRTNYYSDSALLQAGSSLYQDNTLANPVNAGSYSDGTDVFVVIGGGGSISYVEAGICSTPPPPTPTPPPPTPTPTPP
jgi:hypothetical protein